ncbi:MaoC/PaaZ C-terminal domain-containing protein [Bordetella sp. LUAb4]|uniref:MaoC family dehydratase n=1 Tax=Bordetella sp. LUAb4 TaxID=2843195 RepID=UPI001E64C339|nr:MaoC/PaaZ C-terminal domain-containing protein [Bordetella sp. LUAb4]
MTPKKNDRFVAAIAGVTQTDVNAFGALHGTTGRTHTDPEYAQQHFGGVIVQGALVMAPVMDLCDRVLGEAWYQNSEIETKFVAFTRLGDVVTVTLDVQESSPTLLQLGYACTLPDGKVVQAGTIIHRPD